MGGCCCSTRKSDGTPAYYYCPLSMEGRESSEIHGGSASVLLGAGHDLNLDLSIPNTYRAPPTPLPYDAALKCPQPKDLNSFKETKCGCSFKTSSALKIVGELDCKFQDSPLLVGPPRKLDHSKSKGNTPTPVTEEEDVCPICLEEYGSEHPEIITQCKHHFHLACLLEWTERSNACPICDKETIFELP